MAHPYTAEQTPLRRLTDTGIAHLQTLTERDEQELDHLRRARHAHLAELASIDDVMADLQDGIARRQAKMRGDVISLLPAGAPVPSLPNHPGDPHAQQATWDGFAPPETGSFAADEDLSPDPDKNLATFGELHDAQDAREGVAR
jgi:hypothetical protein